MVRLSFVGISLAFSLIFPDSLLTLCCLSENLAAAGVTEVRIFLLSLACVVWTFTMLYYYTGVKQNTAGNILSLTEGFFALILSAWVLSLAKISTKYQKKNLTAVATEL